jgi:O-antigen/teichoic acid export membrane protein
MKLLPKTVFANLGVGLVGRVFSQLFSFFIVIYLARILGPADYGDISLALAIVSYFNLIATFGLPTIGTREVARTQANSQDAVSLIFSLRVWLAIVSYLLLVIYGLVFVSNPRLFHLSLLYGLTMFSSALLIDWVFVGLEDLQSLAVANLFGTLLTCALIFLLVKTAADIYYVPLLTFAGATATSVCLIRYYQKMRILHFCYDVGKFRDWARMGTPFAATALFDQMYGNMDMILLGYFVGAQEVGYYSVAYKIVAVFSGIIGVYSQSTWPVMIRLFATNRQQAEAFFQQNLQTVLYFMIPIIAGGTLLAQNIIEVFFGAAYLPSVIPFIFLLYYVFFMVLSITLSNLLLAAKKDKVYFVTLAMGAIVNAGANLILIPQWRANGSALAMVIAELSIFLFLASKIKRFYHAKWIELKFLGIVLASSGAMLVSLLALQLYFQVHVGILVGAGIILYIGISWPFCAKYMKRTFLA